MARHTSEKVAHWGLLSQKYIWQSLHPGSGREHHRIFVAGMQRSGTNMLMDVLEQSLETDVFHEHDSRAFDNYQMRDESVIKRLMDNSRARVFVIKSLCELQELHQLMETFSPAKTIWIMRDYNDVVNSMLRSFRNMAKQVQRVTRESDSDEWLGGGMSSETREILKELVHDDLDDRSASALQWYFRNVLFFEQSFADDERVLLVGYEKLVTDPKQEFENIFNFSGLEYSPRVVRKVSPRSIGKNPPPEIDEPIRQLCDGLLERFRSLMA